MTNTTKLNQLFNHFDGNLEHYESNPDDFRDLLEQLCTELDKITTNEEA